MPKKILTLYKEERNMAKDFGFPAYEGSEKYVFISYKSSESKRVKALATGIYDKGINIWYDNGLKTGDTWEKTLYSKAKDCTVLVAFVTSAYIELPAAIILMELSSAMRAGKKILPVFLENIRTYPEEFAPFFDRFQRLDAYNITDKQIIAECSSAIKKIFDGASASNFETDVDALIHSTYTLLSQNEFDIATTNLVWLERNAPQRYETWHIKALYISKNKTLFDCKTFTEAQKYFKRAISEAPKSEKARLSKEFEEYRLYVIENLIKQARSFIYVEKNDQAISICKQGIGIAPERYEFHWLMCVAGTNRFLTYDMNCVRIDLGKEANLALSLAPKGEKKRLATILNNYNEYVENACSYAGLLSEQRNKNIYALSGKTYKDYETSEFWGRLWLIASIPSFLNVAAIFLLNIQGELYTIMIMLLIINILIGQSIILGFGDKEENPLSNFFMSLLGIFVEFPIGFGMFVVNSCLFIISSICPLIPLCIYFTYKNKNKKFKIEKGNADVHEGALRLAINNQRDYINRTGF